MSSNCQVPKTPARIKADPTVAKERTGSTQPDWFRAATSTDPPISFEVKRYQVEEMGIGPNGEYLGEPSERTMQALKDIRDTLEVRQQLLPENTVQNISFNVTGQAADAVAVGKRIRALLIENGIHHDQVWVQNGGELLPIAPD